MTTVAIIFMILFNALIIATIAISMPVLLKHEKHKDTQKQEDDHV